MRFSKRARVGFTMVELLVAIALSMVIMAIIAVAFQKGIDAFRTLRAVGQMQDKLRSAESVLIRDLGSEHFGGEHLSNMFQQGYGGPYVRDQRLDLVGWMPPDQGYFQFVQTSPSTLEGSDSDGIPSYMATNHVLRFTAKLTGKRLEDWFYGSGNGGALTAQGASADFSSGTLVATRWAEIAYFMVPIAGYTANGTTLYTLYRQEKPLLTTAITSGGFTYRTPATVAQSGNRNAATTALGTGDDILLTDVISFEIKANWAASADARMPAALSPGMATLATNLDWPFSDLPAGFNFDTGSRLDATTYDWNNVVAASNTVGAPRFRVRMTSLQIRIRVWDQSTQTARQITIVQDI